jgi:hypothetical protein
MQTLSEIKRRIIGSCHSMLPSAGCAADDITKRQKPEYSKNPHEE